MCVHSGKPKFYAFCLPLRRFAWVSGGWLLRHRVPLLVPDFNIVFHRQENKAAAVVPSSQVCKQSASKCESWFSEDERRTGRDGLVFQLRKYP